MHYRTTAYALFILTVLFFCSPISVYGATYKVTPRVIDKEVKPRDILSETITIQNLANHKITIFPSVNEIAVDSGGDVTEFISSSMVTREDSITSWVEITRAVLELAPGEVREIPVTIQIHPKAIAGEYHALIGFGSGRNRDVAEAQVRTGSAPGVLLRIGVDQNQNEFLKLGNFLVQRFVVKEDNSAITYMLSNPGEKDVLPSGEIIIYDLKGQEVGALEVNPERIVLPQGQSTTFTAQLPTEGLFGRYKAMLHVDYGTDMRASVYDTAFFYALSWQKLAFIFLLCLILGIFVAVFIHRRSGFDEYDDDVVHLPVRHKETQSEDREHDINLKHIK